MPEWGGKRRQIEADEKINRRGMHRWCSLDS